MAGVTRQVLATKCIPVTAAPFYQRANVRKCCRNTDVWFRTTSAGFVKFLLGGSRRRRRRGV